MGNPDMGLPIHTLKLCDFFTSARFPALIGVRCKVFRSPRVRKHLILRAFSHFGQSKDFIVGIRAGTGNYQGLSSIYGHFPKTKPHKQGRIENYQEFRHAYVGVTFGVRCNLDTLDCPPKKRVSFIRRFMVIFC